MSKDKVKYYIRGTFIILICLVVALISCAGIAMNGDENQRKIFYIIFGCASLGILVAYWVYAFVREGRIKRSENSELHINDKNGKK